MSDFVRTLNGFNLLFYNNNNEGSVLPHATHIIRVKIIIAVEFSNH